MLENINWNFMDSQHKHLPSKLQILKIKFSYPKQITLTEKASFFLLVFWSSYPIRWDQQWKENSSEPQSGWRTVLWLWHLLVFEVRGCYWHPRTTDRKQNILQRIYFKSISTKSLRCPLRQCKNKKLLTWTSTLFSYTEDLWGLFEHMLGTQRRLTILYCSVLKCHPIIWAARMCLSGHNSMAKCQAYASF